MFRKFLTSFTFFIFINLISINSVFPMKRALADDITCATSLILAAKKGDLNKVVSLLDNGVCVNSINEKGYTALMKASGSGHMHIVKELLKRKANMNVWANCRTTTALHQAIINDHYDIASELIDNRAKLDFEDDRCWFAPLGKAIEKGNLDLVKKLIAAGADVTNIFAGENEFELNVIELAAFNGHLDLVKEFLKYEIESEEALKYAVMKNNLDTVVFLIDNGWDINKQDYYGNTPLMYAIGWENLNIVKELLNRGANVNLKNNDGIDALHDAVDLGCLELVIELIERGANVDSRYTLNQNNTILMKAVEDNKLEITQELLYRGAQIDARSDQGKTALMLAALHGRLGIAKELLDKDADIFARDLYGSSALMFAIRAQKNCYKLVNKILEKLNNKDQRILVNIADNKGDTALMKAVAENNLKAVEELLNFGANVNARNNLGLTALIYAIKHENLELIRELLNRGAYIHAQTNDGITALMLAVDNKSLVLVNELLDRGADINAVDNQGRTALMHACMNGSLAIVKKLIYNGADINVRDHNGSSAFTVAVRNNKEITEELLARDADITSKNRLGQAIRLQYNLNTLPSLNNVRDLKINLLNNKTTISQELFDRAIAGNVLIVRYLLNKYKFDIKELRNLLDNIKAHHNKLNSLDFKNSYKRIGRLLLAQIGISDLSITGRLLGQDLPELPSEIVEKIAGMVDVSHIQ